MTAIPYFEFSTEGHPSVYTLKKSFLTGINWEEDFHLQVIEHAPHTMTGNWRLASPPLRQLTIAFTESRSW